VRRGLIPCAVLLCALPADGGNAMLSASMVNVLTPIDAIPSQAALYKAFGPSPLLAGNPLLAIAQDDTIDLAIALHAIRALPAYCSSAQTCGSDDPDDLVHKTLLSRIARYQASPQTSEDLLRLRAAVEALGATRSGRIEDVDALLPLLGNASRDVRATVVRALGSICNTTATNQLNVHLLGEQTLQVKLAITAALQDLSQCAN
jgi:hypothetical protein